MTDSSDFRPPVRLAIAVALVVLLGFILTLAPTVTFWDAGELIASAKILGIPHPPGTPLFVMMAHVWGTFFPFGEFAWRTNLFTAVLSAAGAGFFFLVVHQALAAAFRVVPDPAGRLLRIGGAAAGAIIGAFTFTNWQNSNETEVYAVATLSIAAVCWLCLLWRQKRGEASAVRMLLLAVYICGVSMGNHLLALLVGPAAIMFIWATLREAPAADPAEARREWAQLAVFAGVWALLLGTGLGSSTLTGVGAFCFAAALVFAMTSGATRFGLAALLIAAIGITPYLFLYIRAGQAPMINEADPSTWDALLAVIRRAQYPVRTPFDDPTVMHGPDNPGRSLTIIGLQIANYIQYFNWQWGRVLGDRFGIIATVLFFGLGLRGLRLHRQADRPGWWMLFTLFLVTGIGLMAYMNFKPGFSIASDSFPNAEQHEVRERDYFFVVSFVTWGLWAGMGLAALAHRLMREPQPQLRRLAPAVFAVALVPVILNAPAASRRHGPDARLAADVAYNLLNSAPPYGILFTYGDNDTFPLWWAQEVEGIRQDVTIVCLALANTDWYVRQLRDNPLRDVDSSALPAIWQDRLIPKPTTPVHEMTDEAIAAAFRISTLQELYAGNFVVDFGPFQRRYAPGELDQPRDIVTLRVLQANLGRRPITWSATAGRGFGGLTGHAVQRGLAFWIEPAVPDTTAAGIVGSILGPVPIDVPMTSELAWETYRYAGLLQGRPPRLEPTAEMQANVLALPFTTLAFAYQQLGQRDSMLANIDRAVQINPDPNLVEAAQQLRFQP